jgi:hypothetical protein
MTASTSSSVSSSVRPIAAIANRLHPAVIVATAAISAYSAAPLVVPLLQREASPKFEVSVAPAYAKPSVPAHVAPRREAIPRRAPPGEPSVSPPPADVVVPAVAGVVAGVAAGLLAPRSGVGLPRSTPPVMRERPFVDRARPWRDSPMRGFEARGGAERLVPHGFLRHGGGFAVNRPRTLTPGRRPKLTPLFFSGEVSP